MAKEKHNISTCVCVCLCVSENERECQTIHLLQNHLYRLLIKWADFFQFQCDFSDATRQKAPDQSPRSPQETKHNLELFLFSSLTISINHLNLSDEAVYDRQSAVCVIAEARV